MIKASSSSATTTKTSPPVPNETQNDDDELFSRSPPAVVPSPDVLSYNTVIQAWANVGSMTGARRAHEWLRHLVVQQATKEDGQQLFHCMPDVYTYTAVLQAWARTGKADRALALLRELQQQHSKSINKVTYMIVLKPRPIFCSNKLRQTLSPALCFAPTNYDCFLLSPYSFSTLHSPLFLLFCQSQQWTDAATYTIQITNQQITNCSRQCRIQAFRGKTK